MCGVDPSFSLCKYLHYFTCTNGVHIIPHFDLGIINCKTVKLQDMYGLIFPIV